MSPRLHLPEVAAYEGGLVDIVVPGDPDDVVRWVGVDPKAAITDLESDPVYEEDDRLWHLRLRAQLAGSAVLSLVRERPGRRPVKLRVSVQIGPVSRQPRR